MPVLLAQPPLVVRASIRALLLEGSLREGCSRGAALGEVEDEHHAIDAAARDVGGAMDDAGVVEQAIAVAGLAAALEQGDVMVAERLRAGGVLGLSA